MYPVFIFDFYFSYGLCFSDVKLQNLKMKKCILLSNTTLNENLFNEILYHEIGHCVFEKYANISNNRYPSMIEEIFCDYYSYLKCGNKFFSIEDIISPNRIRFLNKIIKRNIDFMNLLNTVKIRYNTIIELNRRDYRLHSRITRKFTIRQRYRIIKSERDLIKKYFDQIL